MQERNFNLDLIRALAVFLVISVHFFLNNGFYTTEIVGLSMCVMVAMRTIAMICVPLFLLLTGFLMNKKVLSPSFYRGLIKPLFIYFVAAVCCTAFSVFYLKTPLTLKSAVGQFLNFSAAPYGWYVNMYVGLFLLMPFFNVLYHGLKTKRQKHILILTMVFLTSLPSFLNVYATFLESWWTRIYPLTYYFIGAYLSEYETKLRPAKSFLLLFAVFSMSVAFNIFYSYSHPFSWPIFTSWEGMQNLIASSLTFVAIKNITFGKIPKTVSGFVKKISELSLGIYLMSWIFDSIVYKFLNPAVYPTPKRLPYYFVAVPIVFICSAICAQTIEFLYKPFIYLFYKISLKIKDIREVK